MKILSIGNFYEPTWDNSISDENHIHDALEELGHEVKRLQRGDTIPLTKGQDGGFEFILVSQWSSYDIEWLQTAKNYFSCPLVFWAFDFQEWGQAWCENLIAISNLYLSKRIADSKYPNWQYLSQDFAPKFLDKHPVAVEKDIDVLFTGSYLPWATERNETLKAVDEKFNLVIHSVNAWEGLKDVRPPIMDEGLPELYGRAKVILSIDHTLEAGYHSDRNAQIICCGRRPSFRYIPMSETSFHDDVDYFYSIDDCLKKIEAKLSDPLGIERIVSDTSKYKAKARVLDLLTIVGSIL